MGKAPAQGWSQLIVPPASHPQDGHQCVRGGWAELGWTRIDPCLWRDLGGPRLSLDIRAPTCR